MRIPGWGLPEVQVQAMATTIRRAARLLWALHLSFQDGFDSVLPTCTHSTQFVCYFSTGITTSGVMLHNHSQVSLQVLSCI